VKITNLMIDMRPRAAVDWNIVLRDGFFLDVPGPMPVDRLLTEMLALDPDYVENRVATVFLNGKPVDDLGEAMVANGSELGLSGFMPGIAGITMRRNSPVAALRSQITSKSGKDLPDEPGRIKVRLFNNVTDEAGPEILARGVLLDRAILADFLQTRDELFWRGLIKAEIDGEPVDRTLLGALPAQGRPEFALVAVRRAEA